MIIRATKKLNKSWILSTKNNYLKWRFCYYTLTAISKETSKLITFKNVNSCILLIRVTSIVFNTWKRGKSKALPHLGLYLISFCWHAHHLSYSWPNQTWNENNETLNDKNTYSFQVTFYFIDDHLTVPPKIKHLIRFPTLEVLQCTIQWTGFYRPGKDNNALYLSVSHVIHYCPPYYTLVKEAKQTYISV